MPEHLLSVRDMEREGDAYVAAALAARRASEATLDTEAYMAAWDEADAMHVAGHDLKHAAERLRKWEEKRGKPIVPEHDPEALVERLWDFVSREQHKPGPYPTGLILVNDGDYHALKKWWGAKVADAVAYQKHVEHHIRTMDLPFYVPAGCIGTFMGVTLLGAPGIRRGEFLPIATLQVRAVASRFNLQPDLTVMRELAVALRALRDEQNGPPLLGPKEEGWNEAMRLADAALAKVEGPLGV